MQQNPYEATTIVEPGLGGTFSRTLVGVGCFVMTLIFAAAMGYAFYRSWKFNGSALPVTRGEWLNIGFCAVNLVAWLGIGAGITCRNNRWTLVSLSLIPVNIVAMFLLG